MPLPLLRAYMRARERVEAEETLRAIRAVQLGTALQPKASDAKRVVRQIVRRTQPRATAVERADSPEQLQARLSVMGIGVELVKLNAG